MSINIFKKLPLFKRVELPEKNRWLTRGIFILIGVGLVTALNIWWRFPSLALKYNGGAFYFAYIIALITSAIPLLIMEFALGLRSQRAAARTFKAIHPRWEWLGYWVMFISIILVLYLMVVFVWTLHLTGASIQSVFKVTEELPWAKDSAKYMVNSLFQNPTQSWSLPSYGVIYFIGLLWLIFTYVAVKGVNAISSILRPVFFIGLVLMLITLIRFIGFGIFSTDGGIYGISWALNVDWAQLGNFEIWVDAYTLAIFGYGIGLGLHICASSYLPSKCDIVNNAIIISLTGFFLIFVAFIATSSLLGSQALLDGRPVSGVAEHFKDVNPEGIGTFLLVIPRAISSALPDSPVGKALVSFAFFGSYAAFTFMFLTMLINSIVRILREKFAWRKFETGLLIFSIGFFLTLILAGFTNWVWIDDLDSFVVKIGVVFAALFECLTPGWMLGTIEIRDYVNKNSEMKIGFIWEIAVKIITPTLLVIILVYNLIKAKLTIVSTSSVLIDRIIIGAFAIILVLLSLLLAKIYNKKKGTFNAGIPESIIRIDVPKENITNQQETGKTTAQSPALDSDN